MKIILNRRNILEAVAPLMCAVSPKSTIPYVEGILIEAEEPDTCTLTTFDLQKGVKITVHTKVLEGGSYIINAQKFNQTLKVMEGDEVTLSVNENGVALFEAGRARHQMMAFKGTEFPETPHLQAEHSFGFTVGQGVLKRMLGKVAHAMAANDQRPIFNGCYFKIVEDSMLTVSCDSFRLAKCAVATDIENISPDGRKLNFAFILPAKTVFELQRMLTDDENEQARIMMNLKNIIFTLGDLTFFSRLIDGTYIDYDRVIMTNHSIKIGIERETLIGALERAALITEEKIVGKVRSNVMLEIEENILKISAVSTAGSTYDELPIEHEGGNLVIAFNNRYLLDALQACTADKIVISMTNALSSINIEPAERTGEESELFMLLPVRMQK